MSLNPWHHNWFLPNEWSYRKSRKLWYLLWPCLQSQTSLLLIYFCCNFQSLSRNWLCDPMNCGTPGFPVLHYLPKFAQTHVHWVNDAIQPFHPLLPLLLLPSVLPSIRCWEEPALHIRWSKCQNFSFSISPSNDYSGLISFRINWFDLLAVQGTLKHLLQHHSSKALVLQRSAFFMVQFLDPYMTSGKIYFIC